MRPILATLITLLFIPSAASHGEEAAQDRSVLVEAEGFANHGGWVGRSAIHGQPTWLQSPEPGRDERGFALDDFIITGHE